MKTMKKLVLAGLVLLASVVVLTGCQMEAGGQQGQQGPQGQKVYKFTSEPRILSDYKSPNNTDSEWTYVAFGDWPQTIKAGDVEVTEDESTKKEMGMFTYYLGSDGNYYVKAAENAYGKGDEYKYSNEAQAGQYRINTQWFKVEPIVWRVLNKNCSSTGKALLLAENILTGGIEWDDSKNNYQESNIRKWLNGNSSDAGESDYNGDAGFLQTAFTETAGNFIVPTIVDNSAQSTSDAAGKLPQATNAVCGDTEDKIFLLSEQEATMSDYGFDVYNAFGEGNTRIRVTTDYAKATGACQNASGGLWWLRSPYCNSENPENLAFLIVSSGNASDRSYFNDLKVGIVPALCVSVSDIK